MISVSRMLAVLSFGIALGSAAALAEDAAEPPDPQARLAEWKSRLELSDAQEEQLRPILEQHAAKLKSIRSEYPAELSRSDKRAMFKAAKSEQSRFVEQVGTVLTPGQMDEWTAMRKEMRDKAKERRREQQQ